MTYGPEYNNPEIRSNFYDPIQKIRDSLTHEMDCVDLGCGTCRKAIRLSRHVARIDGVDSNEAMLAVAAASIKEAGIQNIRLGLADNMALPFASKSYDLCTAFLTTWSPAEAHRILRKNGLLIVETLSADDKAEMKSAFGSDHYGPRGRYLNQTPPERLAYLTHQLDPFFQVVSIEQVAFETIISRQGLFRLLQVTPTIRNYSSSQDSEIVERLTPHGFLEVVERRVLITARALQLSNRDGV